VAVKSIIDIGLDDTAFRAFKLQWDKYEKALKSTPAAWALVNKSIDGSRASFDKLVGQMAAANVQSQLRVKAQERADQLTRSSAERWQSMARSTKDFARNIGEATVSLLKWGSITGVISGLIGGGGLFGIDRLALGVSSSRRSALGLGTTIGGEAAFGNAGRLVDPDQFLSSVAGAKFDVTRRVGLLSAGLTPGQIAGDTTETAVALLRSLKKIADTTDPALFAQILQARRLDQFAQPTDLERLRRTSPEEFERVLGQVRTRRPGFELPPGVAERWQDFTTQMSNAGRAIETVFIKGLVSLAPGLGHLSEGVVKFATILFEKGGPLERWIDEFGGALERFSKYIGTPEFDANVRKLVEGIGHIAEAIAKWFPSVNTAVQVGNAVVGTAEGFYGAARVGKAIVGGTFSGAANSLNAYNDFMTRHFGGQITEDQLLGMVRQRENSGDNAISPRGAVGRYQITKDTAKTYGLDYARLLADPAYNEQGSRKILEDLMRRYHGNVSQILGAYNAGPGAEDKYIRTGKLPSETRKYIQGSEGLTVRIENNTGGNAAVSVNALKN